MKRFVLKTSWFILPYLFLFLLMTKLYSMDKGDLIRIGYIIDLFPSYNKRFETDFETPIRYTSISSKADKKEFKILVIGDSFSEQPSFGYKNQLAQTVDVLYIDRFVSIEDNPVQTLNALVNGDFFDEYKVDYVVLESAERSFVVRVAKWDDGRTKNIADISNKVESYKPNEKQPRYNLFSNQALMFLYNSFLYLTKGDRCFEEIACKIEMNRNDLFSIKTNNLLFYIGDLNDLDVNNNKQKVEQLNITLNTLSSKLREKQIQLIVLPAPDKYSMYYEYIENKNGYKKPLFFEHFDKENKEYIYIDSDKLLKEAMKNENDIYFFDDSHWSPKAAKIIAAKILGEIDETLVYSEDP